jgi:hypothetical protein
MLTDEFKTIFLAALVALFFGSLLYMRLRPRHRHRARRSKAYSAWSGGAAARPRLVRPPPPSLAPDLHDPAQQLHAIARVEFECTPLLNRQEARLLPLLESTARDLQSGHRVMAQTSLGELIRPKSGTATEDDRSAAFASINSKRLDFAIIDRAGRLAVAVEYQGSGHHQGTAFMRDAVKREAIRRAGIPFIEVEPDFDPALLRSRISGLLAAGTQAAPVTDLHSRRV